MIKLTATLTHMNIPTESVNRALQVVRGRLERASSETAGAITYIKALLDLDVAFDNSDKARITAFAVTQEVLQAPDNFVDPDEVLKKALKKANDFVDESSNAWLFVKASTMSGNAEEQSAVVDGLETKVTLKADGSIKKGGKQVLALEMYRREAAARGGSVDSGEFTKLIVKELGMSVVGARTYTYNARKSFEAEMAAK